MIPLVHPAHVIYTSADRRPGSPTDLFTKGMKKISDIYQKLLEEFWPNRALEEATAQENIEETEE